MAFPEDHFPRDYRTARRDFIEACEAADIGVTSRLNGAAPGADGKPLFMDTATLGARDAKTALLLMSGTHGVEGYFGSGVQTGLLREGLAARVPRGAKLVLLHALNPYGFSWDRRVNEDNVDVNRNFVDFDTPPRNYAYDELADAIALADLLPETMTAANAKLRAWSQDFGAFALQQAISAGQYRHPHGLYFGGDKESWSAQALKDVFREELKGVERLIVIDFHTGLGEHGTAEMLTEHLPRSAAYRRAKAMWGDYVKSTESGEGVSPPLLGTIDKAVMQWTQGCELTFAALEVGTVSTRDVFRALRRENWLHRNAPLFDAQWDAVKRELRAAFYPRTAAWKRKVWDHASHVVARAIAAIAQDADAGLA